MNKILIALLAAALLFPNIGKTADLLAIEAPLSGIIWACGSEQRMGGDTEKWMEGINRNLQENPYVSGILITAHWDIVNPEKGTYSWVNTDRLVALARKHNKTFKLKIQSGSTTPDWVYEMGAKEFKTKVMNKHRSTFGDTVRIPLPWDEIYLKEFKGFLGQVAVRYGKEENFKGIVLSGGNFNSSEMHLPYKSPGDMVQWESHGDYKQKIVGAYKEMMKYYVETFPGKQIFLHVSGVIGGMSSEVEEIVRYGVENYPEVLTLQNCQLNGKWNNKEMLSYSLVVQSNKKVHVGFQSVAKLDGARMGSVENSVFNYCQGKGEYWEAWQGDGSDIDICRRIDASIKECNKIGLQAYRDAHCKNFPDAPPKKSNKSHK